MVQNVVIWNVVVVILRGNLPYSRSETAQCVVKV